jgi:coatomer subunit beta
MRESEREREKQRENERERSIHVLIQNSDDKDLPTLQELRAQLENGKDEQKIETMKKVLTMMLNGDPLPQLLMHVIRFVMPSKNKVLKKLLLFYWEICPRTGSDGKLKPEMRLMWCVPFFSPCYLCSRNLNLNRLYSHALRNDLQHPNEYIRGNTLRFLCKLREDELLEPCVPTVRQSLVLSPSAYLFS